MTAFYNIAIPHKDILEGKLTIDVFAADLEQAFQNKGPVEYRDAQTFFEKTYLTEGLKNLLTIIQKRLEGKGADPVIQLTTPFGGGKTHSLIAIMHKAREWKAQLSVMVGTNLDANKETLWEILEKQLTGKTELLKMKTAPGKENLRKVLEPNQPLVILMDEVLEYMVKAEGVKIHDSNLASQTFAFLQELTELVASLEKVVLVITLPSSSTTEVYDPNLENLYTKLKKISGRLEKIYTPVEEKEISKVIRKRLFSHINQNELEKTVNEFINYAEKEKILPTQMDPSIYKERFLDSYPFLPDVIDVFYQRWGSYSNFQRTRGVLRILSLIIDNLKTSELPYISLADCNIQNEEIKQELIKYIGPEYNGIISQDITNQDSGTARANSKIPENYRSLELPKRIARTIFMYSFSTGQEHGANLTEIKRNATTLKNPAAVISDALNHLEAELFYVQSKNDKYFFSNTPNLNRLLQNKIENLADSRIEEQEKKFLQNQLSKDYFDIYIWETKSTNIPDTEKPKLIILKQKHTQAIQEIVQTKAQSPRIYRNTILFLYPIDSNQLEKSIRKYLAYEDLLKDPSIPQDDKKNDLKQNLDKAKKEAEDSILSSYQCIGIPSQDGIQEERLGIPTHGENRKLNQRVYEFLKGKKILEKLEPAIIVQKYFQKDFIYTKSLVETFLKTLGEPILASPNVLKESILKGVRDGKFGLGVLVNNHPKCEYFKNEIDSSIEGTLFEENQILLKPELCKQTTEESKPVDIIHHVSAQHPTSDQVTPTLTDKPKPEYTIPKKKVKLRFDIPAGRLSNVFSLLINIQSQMQKISIELEGELSENDYENKLMETLSQLNVSYKELD